MGGYPGGTSPQQFAAQMTAATDAARQKKEGMDMLQRQFLASQYDNVINQPLPDQTKDPEGYQKALDCEG